MRVLVRINLLLALGRSRGLLFHKDFRGSQAGTSRTQGRVYAITPQTEPVDQSIIQCMFLLSRLWVRVLFDYVAYACDCV